MMINAQTGSYRYRAIRPGVRQRVIAGRPERMSPALRQAVAVTLGAALFFVLTIGQLFNWMTMNDYRQVEQLQAVSRSLGAVNINLRAKKAGFMAPKHIEAVAAVRLGLHAPTSGQVHRL